MISWSELDLKGKTSGQIKIKCPACIDRRSNKRDTSLSVNIDNGLANCHYCGEKSIRDFKTMEKKEYKLPPQQWQNYTNLSDKLVKWFADVRKISQKTLIENNVTEEKHYQPALNKEVNNIVFNYFEGETLINKKYRSADKKFTQSAGTKNIFYGINDIIGEKEVYIVEGEIDKLSFSEIGIKNCISVPNGANDNDDVWQNCERYLQDVEIFYIATDKDTKGEEVAEKIAQRLGRWRCKRIEFKNKDANEDLIEGCLESSIKNIKSYPVSGTVSISDFKEGIFNLYNNGVPKTIYPKKNGLERLKNVFSVMRGHLVTVTGIPSHGKSNFLEWYILNLLAENDFKASFFSPEHLPFELHQSNFIQKFYGKSFWSDKDGQRITPNEIQDYIDWANEKIYITFPDKDQTPNWTFLLDTFKQQMYSYGVDIFVIDAFNKVLFDGTGNQREQINEVLTKLTSFAQVNNVIVFLVAHPTKMRKDENGIYESPSLYDVSGSADFRNQTHDGFSIYRNFGENEWTKFTNLKTKFSFQGTIGGECTFKYHVPSGRYYDALGSPSIEPLVLFDKQKNIFVHETENGYPAGWD